MRGSPEELNPTVPAARGPRHQLPQESRGSEKAQGKGAWTVQAETLESRYRVRPHGRGPSPRTDVLHQEQAGKLPAHGSPHTRKRLPDPRVPAVSPTTAEL